MEAARNYGVKLFGRCFGGFFVTHNARCARHLSLVVLAVLSLGTRISLATDRPGTGASHTVWTRDWSPTGKFAAATGENAVFSSTFNQPTLTGTSVAGGILKSGVAQTWRSKSGNLLTIGSGGVEQQ